MKTESKKPVVYKNFVRMNMRGGKFRQSFQTHSKHFARNKHYSEIRRKRWAAKSQEIEALREANYEKIAAALEGKTDVNEAITTDDGVTSTSAPEASAVPAPPITKGIPRVAVHAALKQVFGFEQFRFGQEQILMRVLYGNSSLAVLPTGGGKSLIYQLAAYLLDGLVIVVSPLVSLMQDQREHLPDCIPGAVISYQSGYEHILSQLLDKKIKVLYISPERLCDQMFVNVIKCLPSIPLVCVDEAHCVSEWSHHFRPAYMRLGPILQELNVKCILALTATATSVTARHVMRALHIPDSGLVTGNVQRSNLHISVSKDFDRDAALVSLLKQQPYRDATSIIIYCQYKNQTEQVAALLRTNLLHAEAYHAGRHEKDRLRVQNDFMSNKLTIIVATIAFGMGLDKSDVDAVIHYSMPKSPENYIQEIGRAGRGGQPAYCHLFFKIEDLQKQRSYAHTDGVDEIQITRLLNRVFRGGVLASGKKRRKAELSDDDDELEIIPEEAAVEKGHLVALPVQITEEQLDMRQEVVMTILSYVESRHKFIRVLPQSPIHGHMTFFKTPAAELALTSPLIGEVVLQGGKRGVNSGKYSFSIVELANSLHMSLQDVCREMFVMKNRREIGLTLDDPAFVVQVCEIPQDLPNLCSQISAYLREVETTTLYKVDALFGILNEVCLPSYNSPVTPEIEEARKRMAVKMDTYFTEFPSAVEYRRAAAYAEEALQKREAGLLRSDIAAFLRECGDPQEMTGRAVARIFHGIESPAFPRIAWQDKRVWGKYVMVDFHAIRQIATHEIIAARERR